MLRFGEDNKNWLLCFRQSPLFSYLTDNEFDLLNWNSHEVSYKPGETILKQNGPLTHVVVMNEGLAKIHIQGSDNKEFILRIEKTGELVTGAGLFFDNKQHYTMTAITNVNVCLIDSEIFKSVIKNNNKFTETYLFHIHSNIADSLNRIITLNQKNSHGRFAESILYMADKIYQSDSFVTHLSRTEMADLAGISLESTFKIMNSLSKSKIINIEGNKIQILNRELLEKINRAG